MSGRIKKVGKCFCQITVLALALGCGSALAADPGVSDKEIVIGGVMPYTGPAGQLGYTITMGMRLGAEEINDTGGINGRKIKLVVEDDQYVPSQSVQALQKLIDIHEVFALGGVSGGSQLSAMLPTIMKNNIPVINPAVTTGDHYTADRPNLFGIGMDYQDGAYELIKLVNERHPGEKWASMVADNESGSPREEGYDRAITELKLDSVLKLRFKPKQMDFSAEILRLKAAGATALHLGGNTALNATIMKEARKQGLNLKFAGLWTDHTPPMIDLAGPEGDGMYIYDFVPSITDKDASGEFLALAEKYLPADDLPKVNRFTLLGFVLMKVYGHAIEQCGDDVTRVCVIDKIQNTVNYSAGVGAPVSFGNGVRLSPLSGSLLTVDYANRLFVPVK